MTSDSTPLPSNDTVVLRAVSTLLEREDATTRFKDLKDSTGLHQSSLSQSLKRLQAAKLLWRDPDTKCFFPLPTALHPTIRDYVVSLCQQFDLDFDKARLRGDYTGQIEALRTLGPAGAALGLPPPVIPEFKERRYAKRGENFTGKKLSDDKILAYKSRIMEILGSAGDAMER